MWAPPIAGFEIDSVASQGAQLVGLVTQSGDLTFTLTVLDDAGRASTDTVVVHVNDPNVIQDAITITAARFDVGRQLWDVVGSSTVEWNQRVDLYFALLDETGIMVRDANGNPVKDPNRRIGAAIVGALGVWRYRLPVSILEPENVPTALDTTILAESALGGRATIVFRASR
jgi:hypothetical protein